MNTIDLSKCKIGQKLKRRDGEIVVFSHYLQDCTLPCRCCDGVGYTKDGFYLKKSEKTSRDIVEIIPLEKKTAKKEKPSYKPWTAKQKAAIRQILKLVKQLDEHTNDVTK